MIFLFPVVIFSQTDLIIHDTLSTVTLQRFNVPQDKYIVLTNIKSINFHAELLDSSLNKIRDCFNFSQSPSKEELSSQIVGKRGVLVQYVLNESIEQIGRYYYKVTASYVDEFGSDTKTGYYMVNVTYPTMASDIDIRENRPYYYSESKTFSFTTVEFKNAYSFLVTDEGDNVIDSGKGSLVVLDKVFNDLKNVGRKIKVHGRYYGKEFSYKSPRDNKIRNSVWEFEIAKPNLEEFSDWTKNSDNDEVVISAWNKNAMRILYTYIGSTSGGFVVVAPEPQNFRIIADPQDMIVNPRYSRSGNFLYVAFNINPDFLDQMVDCGEQRLELTIQFRTQFGERITKEYSATILK